MNKKLLKETKEQNVKRVKESNELLLDEVLKKCKEDWKKRMSEPNKSTKSIEEITNDIYG